ncbi:hypothetical protein ACFYXF_31450 [Streptomyces sp. NPDC002680]|uniref:hypothetical protein n=1 Tax=Streptomyces sp. NPDC002680 TaxID=3364659 RepID=UPI0036B6E741
MIIPRRPTEYWVRLIAVDTDDRILLVGEERPGTAPRWTLPGVRRRPDESAEGTADSLLADLALPATEPGPRHPHRRTVSSVVAGEVTRHEEFLFVVRLRRPGPPRHGAHWCTLPELSAPTGPALPPDLADHVSEILDGPVPVGRAPTD